MKKISRLPLNDEQQAWFDGLPATDPALVNPCVRLFGKGPADEICKHCTHLYANRCSKTYYKCNLRKHTNGPGSDHKVTWAACAKFGQKNS